MSDFIMVAGRTGPNQYYYNPTVLNNYCRELAKAFSSAPPRGFSLSTYRTTLELWRETALLSPERRPKKVNAGEALSIMEFFGLFARSFLIAARSDETLTEHEMLPAMSLALGLQFPPSVETRGSNPLQQTFLSVFTRSEKRWLTNLLKDSARPGRDCHEHSALFKRALVVFHVNFRHYLTLRARTDELETPPATWQYVEQSLEHVVNSLLARLERTPEPPEFLSVEQTLFNQVVFWHALRANYPDFAHRYLE